MILIYSENSIQSENVKDEIALAAKKHLAIIPVRIQDIEPDEFFDVRLARLNWVDVFEMQQEKLIELAAMIGKRIEKLRREEDPSSSAGASDSADAAPAESALQPAHQGERLKPLADFFRAVLKQFDEDQLKEWCDPDTWYSYGDFTYNTPEEMIESLTQIHLNWCAPLTKTSMASIYKEDVLENCSLSEEKFKTVCASLGVDSKGRKGDLIRRLTEKFSEAVDKAFPEGRGVYPDNPSCPPDIAKWTNTLVGQLSVDQLKDFISEFHVDSTIRRNSRTDMMGVLCKIYRCFVPVLSHNARRAFFSDCFSELNEEQIMNFCEAIAFDAKGRKKERIEKLMQVVP